MPKRVSISAVRERALRDDAVREAEDLFARHGAYAIDLLSERLVDRGRGSDQRRADRLTLLAVEKLDRERRQGGASQALVVWKPPLFSRAGLAALFGFGRRRPRT